MDLITKNESKYRTINCAVSSEEMVRWIWS